MSLPGMRSQMMSVSRVRLFRLFRLTLGSLLLLAGTALLLARGFAWLDLAWPAWGCASVCAG
ncbi:hypothetical protein BL240_01980 [Pseudomonas putida]|uniref:Uncharacterized protein n=1 Tax=Pseudomonas putida TaxID=303 RepID=A0A1L5PJT4_PSEPU|nr:hypothetical protein BL240_01980 [Pseudomonas putida]